MATASCRETVGEDVTQSVIKIIAMLTMLIDHIGMLLFPDVTILRIIGRLAFPIFAYCIAEGCVYTRNHKKYMLRILICAVIFQVIDFIVSPQPTLCVLWSYAAAVGFVVIYKWAKQKWSIRNMMPVSYALLMSLLLLVFQVDYLFFGFLFIVAAYLLHHSWTKWIPLTILLVLLGLCYQYQFWALMAIPILMLYNGKQDKLKLGRVLYYFYPLHYLMIGILCYLVKL